MVGTARKKTTTYRGAFGLWSTFLRQDAGQLAGMSSGLRFRFYLLPMATLLVTVSDRWYKQAYPRLSAHLEGKLLLAGSTKL